MAGIPKYVAKSRLWLPVKNNLIGPGSTMEHKILHFFPTDNHPTTSDNVVGFLKTKHKKERLWMSEGASKCQSMMINSKQ